MGPGDQPGWLYPKNIWSTWPKPSSFWETGRCRAFSWFFETEHVFGWCILGICFNFIYFTHAFWVALQIFAREEVKKEFAIWGGRGISPALRFFQKNFFFQTILNHSLTASTYFASSLDWVEVTMTNSEIRILYVEFRSKRKNIKAWKTGYGA